MRLVSGLLLLALLSISPALLGDGRAAAFSGASAPPARSIVRAAKIVCGDFGSGYTCRSERGAVRRGKMRKIPGGGSSGSSGGGWFGGGSDDSDALPPPSGDASSGTGAAPASAQGRCPANAELLGGHCIPYTQRCTNAIPPAAHSPQCRGEEKQVCKFHPDGSKDCCCRTYSKF